MATIDLTGEEGLERDAMMLVGILRDNVIQWREAELESPP